VNRRPSPALRHLTQRPPHRGRREGGREGVSSRIAAAASRHVPPQRSGVPRKLPGTPLDCEAVHACGLAVPGVATTVFQALITLRVRGMAPGNSSHRIL
jgi:hypothetical protein